MEKHRQTLRRVGLVLIIAGVLDIGYMVYCIVNGISYSSSFNVFAVIAGIFLLRGHLGAVRVVTWFSAFMLTGFLIASVVLFPQLQPLEYSLLQLRTDPLGSALTLLLMVGVIGIVGWVYFQLRTSAVVEARVAAGQRSRAPISAFLAGSALALGLTIVTHFTIHGDMGKKAMRLAAEQYGPRYKYFVSAMHWGGSHVSAKLTAYDDKEAKEVRVEWKE